MPIKLYNILIIGFFNHLYIQDSNGIFMANKDKNNLKRLQEIVKVLSKYEFGYLIEKLN
jgi:hypothetical protein